MSTVVCKKEWPTSKRSLASAVNATEEEPFINGEVIRRPTTTSQGNAQRLACKLLVMVVGRSMEYFYSVIDTPIANGTLLKF
mgnify:CR=1 FL=1